MKQLITRIDDELHRRLKARAAEQDRSLNDLVSSVLAAAVEDGTGSLRRRIARSGLHVLPAAPVDPRPRAAVIEDQRGKGRAASEALAATVTPGERALRRHLGAGPLLLPERARPQGAARPAPHRTPTAARTAPSRCCSRTSCSGWPPGWCRSSRCAVLMRCTSRWHAAPRPSSPGDEPVVLVSRDRRQVAVARALGMPVE